MNKSYLFLIIVFLLNFSFSSAIDNQYYFVFLNTNPEREELSEDKVMELQEGHTNNINRLAKEGKLLIAGPVKGGGGIFVLVAPTLEEANEYLQTDPAIKAKRFNLEVYPMNLLEGNICKVPGEDFHMVNYTFIRYSENISITDRKMILTQIGFEGRDDGILVVNYNLEEGNEEELKNFISADRINYIKTIWIARGSFCE
jgi:uncharacterized protein YciI